jgi:hypothetical protein
MKRAALGWKTHSGWAALVVIAAEGDEIEVLDRRRIELVGPNDPRTAKAPYHAAEALGESAARELVTGAIAFAAQSAQREMRAALERARAAKLAVETCAVLAGTPMPAWTIEEIRAVHFRMHKAEGLMWSDAILAAATACGLASVAVPEKTLAAQPKRAAERIARLGKTLGPPWGADQKQAAHAAWLALRGIVAPIRT